MSNPLSERSYDRAIDRRKWLTRVANFAVGSVLAKRSSAQQKLLPLQTSGLDHLSLTVPDPLEAARFYGRIFDPQVFHERTGVQRYYVRLGSSYIAFGPNASVPPYIDHIAFGVIGFMEADFGSVETRAEITAAGLAAPPGVLPMLSDPDNLRLQLVNTNHGLFDTIMPGGRVTQEPAALIPVGLDHIMLSVADVDGSVAYYRKLFGAEESHGHNPKRVWFKLAGAKLGLEAASDGRKPGFSHFAVKVAGFHRSLVTTRLGKLGISVEPGGERGSLRFRDLHNLPVEVVAG